jgi:hypothetical protein
MVAAALAAAVNAAPTACGDDETLPGFILPVSNIEPVADTAPRNVELLSQTILPKDPLDLQLMSQWSLNYLAGTITIEDDFASSYGNWPLKMPPYAIGGDTIAIGDTEVRNALAFVLMREMSGSNYAADIQQGAMNRILRYQLPCGLFSPPMHGDTDVLWATAWMARALIEEFVTTGNREALSRAERALRAVRRYAVEANDQGLLRLAPKDRTIDGQPVRFAYRRSLDFCIVEPFVRYSEVTGDKEMLDIATGLVEGRLQGFSKHNSSHTHSHWHSVVGVAHLGAVTGEKRYLDWAENQLTLWTDRMTDYGWFEAADGYGASETCALSDLMHVCIYLGRAGRATRYDLAERAVRNNLAQVQFFADDNRFQQLRQKQSFSDPGQHMKLLRRLEGGFLCRTTPGDRWAKSESPEGPISLEGCCPSTGMTGLSLAWRDIVRQTDKGTFVNMAFNRNSAHAEVVSFLPQKGRLTVVPKHNGTVYIRIPGFASKELVAAWKNAQRRDRLDWMGDYVVFSETKKGDELTVTYPLVSFVQRFKRAGTVYTVNWQGNAVTHLDPMGTVWPLFEKIPYPIPAFAPSQASE